MPSFGGFGSTQGALATKVSSAAFPLLAPNGTAGAPSYSFSGDPDTGFVLASAGIVDFSAGSSVSIRFYSGGVVVGSGGQYLFSSTSDATGSADVVLVRDAANVLALKRTTVAQTFRVYGSTTGTKYTAISHDATDAVISSTFGHISLRTVDLNTAANVVNTTSTATITGAVTDGYTAGLRLTPTYSAASALTVTRHNYIDLNGATLSGAGPAALTDACVFRFNAAAGTHKATVGATTKTTPGGVDAWVKINMNGTLMYIPAYTSTTA